MALFDRRHPLLAAWSAISPTGRSSAKPPGRERLARHPRRVLAPGLQAGHRNAYECIAAFSATDFRADVARFDVATLVIHGDYDPVVPFAVGGQASAALIDVAGALGGSASGLRDPQTTRLSAPGRPDLEVMATPCRQGPPHVHFIIGNVIGFALRWEGHDHAAL